LKSTPRERLLEFFELTSDELDLLERLRGPAARFARHAEIRRAGDKVQGVFLLLDGWVLSSAEMPGGQRQVLKVHMPGDMLGSPSMVLLQAMETLTAVTPVTIVPVPLSAFGRLGRMPRKLFPAERRAGRWILALRAQDARSAGASQRDIAELLFGTARTRADWTPGSDYLRSQIRRLLTFGERMRRSGWRSLLGGVAQDPEP